MRVSRFGNTQAYPQRATPKWISGAAGRSLDFHFQGESHLAAIEGPPEQGSGNQAVDAVGTDQSVVADLAATAQPADFFRRIDADDRVVEISGRAPGDGLVQEERVEIQAAGETQFVAADHFIEQFAAMQEFHAMCAMADHRVPGLRENPLVDLLAAQCQQAAAELVAGERRLVDHRHIEAMPRQGVRGGGAGGAGADDEDLMLELHDAGLSI